MKLYEHHLPFVSDQCLSGEYIAYEHITDKIHEVLRCSDCLETGVMIAIVVFETLMDQFAISTVDNKNRKYTRLASTQYLIMSSDRYP